MKIEVLMLADTAEVTDGLLQVDNGGWEHFLPTGYPCLVSGTVCGIITLDDAEIGTAPVVEVGATTQGGKKLDWSIAMTLNADRKRTTTGVPMRQPFAVPLKVTATSPMVMKIVVSGNGAELAAVSFEIRETAIDEKSKLNQGNPKATAAL